MDGASISNGSDRNNGQNNRFDATLCLVRFFPCVLCPDLSSEYPVLLTRLENIPIIQVTNIQNTQQEMRHQARKLSLARCRVACVPLTLLTRISACMHVM